MQALDVAARRVLFRTRIGQLQGDKVAKTGPKRDAEESTFAQLTSMPSTRAPMIYPGLVAGYMIPGTCALRAVRVVDHRLPVV